MPSEISSPGTTRESPRAVADLSKRHVHAEYGTSKSHICLSPLGSHRQSRRRRRLFKQELAAGRAGPTAVAVARALVTTLHGYGPFSKLASLRRIRRSSLAFA